MVREIGVALETIAAEIPLLLILEDMQWVDHSTVDVLSALARRRVPAQADGGRHKKRPIDAKGIPAIRSKRSSRTSCCVSLCHELELERLTQSEVTEYLAAESSKREPARWPGRGCSTATPAAIRCSWWLPWTT